MNANKSNNSTNKQKNTEKEFHNVSVRLTDPEYKQLIYLQEKFDSMSYGKVTQADVLRIAIREIYGIETLTTDKPVTVEKQIKERQALKQELKKQLNTDNH